MATKPVYDKWSKIVAARYTSNDEVAAAYKSEEKEDSFRSWMQGRVLSNGEEYCVSPEVHTLRMKLCWQW